MTVGDLKRALAEVGDEVLVENQDAYLLLDAQVMRDDDGDAVLILNFGDHVPAQDAAAAGESVAPPPRKPRASRKK